MRKNLAPIILFVYNRPNHTKKTVEALKDNELSSKSNLYIFSDGFKNEKDREKVKQVRKYIKTIKGFQNIQIYEANRNKGLANSIIDGVTDIINEYGKVIVLEDDLITASNFLRYMNKALNFYKNDLNIWSISAYNPPIEIPENYNYDVYLSYRACSWGWGTWIDRWDKIDWQIKDHDHFIANKKMQKKFNIGGNDMSTMLKDQMEGKIDSWAIRWCYNQFKYNMFTIYPVVSKIQNIGNDGSGVHCKDQDRNIVMLDNGNIKTELTHNLSVNKKILKKFKVHYNNKLKWKIGELFKKIGMYKYIKSIIKKF